MEDDVSEVAPPPEFFIPNKSGFAGLCCKNCKMCCSCCKDINEHVKGQKVKQAPHIDQIKKN